MLVSVAAVQAPPVLADAQVRFAHAVPGAGEAELQGESAGQMEALGEAGFGEIDDYRMLPAGRVSLQLVAPGSDEALAMGARQLSDGKRYTIVALLEGERVKLKLYADGRAKRGEARMRVIHAAPELGSPDLAVDGETVATKLAYEAATPYLSLEPGEHSYGAMRPGGEELFGGEFDVRTAKAYTTLVVGSRGEPVRVAMAVDDTARPASTRSASGTSTGAGDASYVVRPGDSLWAIAERQLGSGAEDAAIARRLVRIWNANEARIGTGDPNLIYPGTKLRLS